MARSGKPDSALSLLVEARTADPDNLDLQLAHARVLGWAGRRGEAESVYDSVLARSPADVDAVVSMGYVFTGRVAKAPNAAGRNRAGARLGQCRRAGAATSRPFSRPPFDAVVGRVEATTPTTTPASDRHIPFRPR